MGEISDFEEVTEVLDESPDKFPAEEYDDLKIKAGKTLYKGKYWKAVLLVKANYYGEWKHQLRMFTWEKYEGEWSRLHKFNVSDSEYLAPLKVIIEKFSSVENPEVLFSEEFLGEQAELRDEIENLQKQLVKKQEKVKEERRKREEEAKEERKDKIDELEQKVDEFEEMIEDDLNESEYQKFLKENEWFFGSEYFNATREHPAGYSGRADFYLERRNSFGDLIELKLPKDDLFIDNPEGAMSGTLKNALSQVADYMDFYRQHRQYHEQETGVNMYNPRAYIVLGRRKDDKDVEKMIKKHESVIRGDIKIWTYDQLIDNARNTLDTLRSD